MAYRIAALACAILVAMAASAQDAPLSLTFIDSTRLHHREAGLTEPSGLSIRDDSSFFVVSDDTSAVFAVHAGGQILSRQEIAHEVQDLEGVEYDPERQRLLVLSEKMRAIIDIDPDSGQTNTIHPISGVTGGAEIRLSKDGPEGLAIGREGEVLVLIEYPPQLVRISPELTKVLEVVSLDAGVGFASSVARRTDGSGLAYDRTRDALWILSDTGKAVFFRPVDGEVFLRFELVFADESERVSRVHNSEGIAVSKDGTMLFVATDDGKSSRLLKYLIK